MMMIRDLVTGSIQVICVGRQTLFLPPHDADGARETEHTIDTVYVQYEVPSVHGSWEGSLYLSF